MYKKNNLKKNILSCVDYVKKSARKRRHIATLAVKKLNDERLSENVRLIK